MAKVTTLPKKGLAKFGYNWVMTSEKISKSFYINDDNLLQNQNK
jgi:hypothetical protein